MFSVSNVTRTLCMAKRKTTPLDDAATDSIFDVLGTTPDEASASWESSSKSIKQPKTPQLAKSIKEEALALFQKGLTIEEVARELMLPPSAVRDWEALYQDGKLTKFGKARIAADEREKQEPTLFFKAK